MTSYFLFAFFLMVVPARADGVFRDMIWGASKEDVHKFESAKFYKAEGDSLYFLEQPDDFRRLITYDFKGGKLWRGRYEYVELHNPDPKVIMDMFGNLQVEFDKAYGAAQGQEFLWKDKTYLYYPQFWGRALQSGDLRMRATWRKGDSKITLETYNDGTFYQLSYVAQQAGPDDDAPDPQHILRLPGAVQEEKKQP